MSSAKELTANHPPKHLNKFARKLAFSKFVQSKETHGYEDSRREKKEIRKTREPQMWECCSTTYSLAKDIHKHVALAHEQEVKDTVEKILADGCEDARWSILKKSSEKQAESLNSGTNEELALPCSFLKSDQYPWLPCLETGTHTENDESGQILLFYKYRDITNTEHVRCWQEELCTRLGLTGKVRIGTEGINCTVGGSVHCTEIYIEAVRKHLLFCDMQDNDFKRSTGDAKSFPGGLKVGVYQEIVPMGISPKELSHKISGKRLSVDEFHEAAKKFLKKSDQADKSVFIDCRNFYESRIGQFEGALCPDIRKFSYWPEYVNKNRDLFENKDVYMYCTGGIRCERGSAYLLSKGVCKSVYQLEGGIHKYIEKYPDGYFRGKMFVFDDRYHIQANSDVLSGCKYCRKPWDEYKPCSSSHCHQLILICPECRQNERTACCPTCQNQGQIQGQSGREECECTEHRDRVPKEDITAAGLNIENQQT